MLQTLSVHQVTERAVALHRGGCLDDAEILYWHILEREPDNFDARHLLGLVRYQQGRDSEALGLIRAALKISSNVPNAWSNYGSVLLRLRRPEEALASYDRALTINPDYAEALHNRGNALRALKRFPEALASYDKAIAIRPTYAEALNGRGLVLHYLTRFVEALASYDQAIAIKPDFAGALHNRGNALLALSRLDEALLSYRKALAVDPDHPRAFSGLARLALQMCDWASTTRLAAELEARVREGRSIIEPFTLISYSDDASLLLEGARRYVRYYMPVRPTPLWTGEVWRNERIRIAYLSSDFNAHATSCLTAELFELHDRDCFEIIAISHGPDDDSPMRSRVGKAFDQFHDVRLESDRNVAILMRRLKIYIAVDLNGYTQGCRPAILAFRPAPIQVNYLGFPGTLGADFIDYIIADEIVAPSDLQKFCTERIVHLPDCFQVNDSKRTIGEHTPSRQQVGLPEHGFVFCCFNNNYKITPAIFDVWMRLLRAVDHSVLWLLRDNEAAERNLRREAMIRGVDPARLVFAGRVKRDEHLARHRLADLFLDTLPVNAGTTASDALWLGLPVLTCRGNSAVGRVGISLLSAVGLPELAVGSLEAYEALALKLATDPSFMNSIKLKLRQTKASCPLFDTSRFCRHIEAAYKTMWDLWQRGENPRQFSVDCRKDYT